MPIGCFAARPASSIDDDKEASLVRRALAAGRRRRRPRRPWHPRAALLTVVAFQTNGLPEHRLLEIIPRPAAIDHQKSTVVLKRQKRMVPDIAPVVHPLVSPRQEAAQIRSGGRLRHHHQVILLLQWYERLAAQGMA